MTSDEHDLGGEALGVRQNCVAVSFASPLRAQFGLPESVSVEAHSALEALLLAAAGFENFRSYLFTEDGSLQPYVVVFANGVALDRALVSHPFSARVWDIELVFALSG